MLHWIYRHKLKRKSFENNYEMTTTPTDICSRKFNLFQFFSSYTKKKQYIVISPFFCSFFSFFIFHLSCILSISYSELEIKVASIEKTVVNKDNMILDLSNEIDTLRGADSEYELEVKLLKEQIVALEKENILFQKKEKEIEKAKQKEMEKVKQNQTKLTTALTTLKEQKENNQHQIQELITSHNAAAIVLKEQVTAAELQKKELLLKLTKEQDKYILLTTKYEEEKKMQNKFSKENLALQINQLNELTATLKTSLHVSQVSETKATATIQEMNGTVTQLNQVNATLILSNTKANTTIKEMEKLMKLKIENEKEKNKSIQLLESKLLVQKTDIIQATQQRETETNDQLSTISTLNTEISFAYSSD